MKTAYRTACVRRQAATSQDDNVRWARSFVAEPTRSPEHALHQEYVADLLAQIEVAR